MKLTRYHVEVPVDDTHIGVLATLSSGLIVVPKDLWETIKSEPERLSEEVVEQLEEQGYLVSSDEEDTCRARWWVRKFLEGGNTFYFAFAPTMDCNLSCRYCYEWKERASSVMSEQTGKVMIARMEQALDNNPRYSHVAIGLFGGEIMIQPDLTLKLSQAASKVAQDRNMTVSFSMITNGTRLTRKWLEDLVATCSPTFIQIQVTIDGPKDVHDSRRTMVGGGSSFDEIMRCITSLRGLPISLAVRTNVDDSNYNKVPDLYKELSRHRHLLPEKLSAYLFPVYPTKLPHDQYCILPDEYLTKIYPLWLECANLGWEVASPIRYGPCGQASEHVQIVDPDGLIYTCGGMLGKKDMAVGSVYEDRWFPNYFEHLNHNAWESCISGCEVLPFCMGGCRDRAMVELGDWKARYCRKEAVRNSMIAFTRFSRRRELEGAVPSQDAVK